jgi:4-aminobutyrate aminotransferase/(S)-3-amino-2-methylpropionate transaminase
VIADEVQTGFSRTGPAFACERFGLEPDLIVSAKSISGGTPLAAVTGRAEIMDSPCVGGLGGTFGGNPLSCAAAVAAWETFDGENLPALAARFEGRFRQRTRQWKERFTAIGEIRGVGAMWALELVRDQTTREPAPGLTQQVLIHCHQAGLLILSAGTYGNVVRLLPPLVATEKQVEEGLSLLEEALVRAGA